MIRDPEPHPERCLRYLREQIAEVEREIAESIRKQNELISRWHTLRLAIRDAERYLHENETKGSESV